jgi:nucleotide-binding universal stress UspA family protein
MNKVNRILVAIDFSPCSRVALEQALSLSGQLGASVDVLHVAEVPAFRNQPRVAGEHGTTSLDDYAAQEARRELDAFLAAMPTEQRAKLQVLVESGHARNRIIARAKQGYDLLVMGTHGRTGRAHALAGSVTESLVRVAPCPVLAVREPD